MSKIHFSGGVEIRRGNHVDMRLSGWPACVSGEKAMSIKINGNQSAIRADVTCNACQRLLKRADDSR